VWSGCSPAISLFTKVHIRWLYRACGPHSNIVCHARNTASLSLSLSLSLSQMQFNSLPQNARQFNSVPLISSPFHFKDSMISCSIINMHSYSNNNYSWSCEGLFAHTIHSTSLSLAFTHSLFFSNVSSIITGSVGCYGVS